MSRNTVTFRIEEADREVDDSYRNLRKDRDRDFKKSKASKWTDKNENSRSRETSTLYIKFDMEEKREITDTQKEAILRTLIESNEKVPKNSISTEEPQKTPESIDNSSEPSIETEENRENEGSIKSRFLVLLAIILAFLAGIGTMFLFNSLGNY